MRMKMMRLEGKMGLLPYLSNRPHSQLKQEADQLEYPGSQSYQVMRTGSLDGEDGEDENESEDEKECEVEAVAAGGAAVRPAGVGVWSARVGEKNAKQEAEQG
ncbi:hypothetical protein FQA47_012148 [Oryzias melastigma]|uniref:Uncharacterized protein n=1 Tax=Oryzias melastigma TaxID=30732 RepID=A0A834FJA0_ORYME|nr:hypothetical protein FQA47_012148 [Oryzias melastigma]